ncbi:MAG: Holliday junction branch migration protein RuvA [Prevotella sp.]|nr:Holliday junction branch migration protein RuvA [Prevotella sp.]
MIEYIKGELTEITPTQAVVEAHGVGYGINISLNTYTAIQTKKEVKLYIHEAIMTGGRDDSYTLYGFVTKQERELYRMLITVSGVGSNTARMILSATTPTELVNVISTGNEKMLKSVKGIGLRTAQRIIVDLRDKMSASGLIADLATQAGGDMQSSALIGQQAEVRDEAVGALTMLGFSPAPSHKVVTEILKAHPELPVEQVIKQALKMIK